MVAYGLCFLRSWVELFQEVMGGQLRMWDYPGAHPGSQPLKIFLEPRTPMSSLEIHTYFWWELTQEALCPSPGSG